MKKFLSFFAVLFLALSTLVGCASTNTNNQPTVTNGDGKWVKISEKTVNFKTETDTVSPTPLIGHRAYSKIKLTCTQGTVNIKNITVNMTDGSSQKLDTLGTLTNGMSTRAMMLAGDDLKLKSIDLEYSSVGNVTLNAVGVTKKAKVEVWGKKSVK